MSEVPHASPDPTTLSMPEPLALRPKHAAQALGIRITSYNVCYTKLLRSYTGLVKDDYGILLETFREALSKNDVIIFTGGAAVGDFDLVPGLLADEGFRTLWTRTGLKPGNPMSFRITSYNVCYTKLLRISRPAGGVDHR